MVIIDRRIITGLFLLLFMATQSYAIGRTKSPKLHNTSVSRTMSKASEYVDQYKEAAMEQMRRYGIPASITLAQGILESGSGQSELSRKGNNHFGIKATSSWLENGGSYLVYADDKPNEKFCQYASVADSYEHHSLFLKSNKRYSELFKLPPDDYVGWTKGLQAAGYATDSRYAASLQAVIRSHGLDKYDKMVIQQGYTPSQSNQTDIQQSSNNNNTQTTKGSPLTNESEVKPQTEVKDKDFFNSIVADNGNEDSWKRFFDSTESNSHFSMDPIVEIASTMFAGLMALAIQIDNMDEAPAVQQSQQSVNSMANNGNELASRNFEAGMNSINNNSVKRIRS